ncbi:cytochrome P450 [Nocardia tengchongensis]|uniref:cytochrome P450 n=1 Tax=Nocardia tengchongensis TaxID=2055889 RepID=UPI0036C22D49
MTYPFPTDQINPPAEFAERRANDPFGSILLASGHKLPFLVTHADVSAALADPRLSHDITAPGSPRQVLGPSHLDNPGHFANMDGEQHKRLRRLAAPAFSAVRMKKLEPVFEQICVDMLDAMERNGSSADIVDAYCAPLPARILCRLLGVPEVDAPRFRNWSNAYLSAAKMSLQDRQIAIQEFSAYLTELVAQRRNEPGNLLIDDLISARDGDDRLSEDEMLRMITGLIAAGSESTSNSLSRYLITLLGDNRTLWQQLLDDPDMIPDAVDELLRHTILGQAILIRRATEDVELPSGFIAAGEFVAMSLPAAQRDETAFPDPDVVDFGRISPPSVYFGAGPHRCLGAQLAKAELCMGLRLLLERLPNLHLTTTIDELRFTNGEFISSPESLQVAW